MTTIVSAPAATMTTGIANFVFSSNELDVDFECSLDGGQTYGSCGPEHELTGLGLGEHTLIVRAIDAALNVGAPVAHTWTVALPDTTIESAPPAPRSARSRSSRSPRRTSPPAPGSRWSSSAPSTAGHGARATRRRRSTWLPAPHTLEVRAKSDLVDDTPAAHSWTIGDTTIDSGPELGPRARRRRSTSRRARRTPRSSARSLTDGDPTFAACTSPQSHTGLANGEYTFLVRATDTHGNVDATPAEWEWEIGPMPSPVTITAGPAATTTDTTATFEFAADETSPTFECSLDGGTFAPCASPKSYSGLALGAHNLQVRLFDPAFIVEPPVTTHDWTIVTPGDTTPPETTGVSGPTGSTAATTATFEFSANEAGTFECSLDGTAFAACTSPVTLTGLAVGPHSFAVQARDAAGNVDASPHTWNWTVSTCTTTTVTLTADGDAWFNSGSPAENKGADSILKVMSKSGGNLRSVVRFPMGTVPAGCTVKSATLQMWNDSPRNGRTLQALRVTGAWTEMGVSWGNQPATTGPAAEIPSGSAKGWRTWTVTSQVAAMYAAGGGQGFLIRDKVENQDAEQQFFSREKGESAPARDHLGPDPLCDASQTPARDDDCTGRRRRARRVRRDPEPDAAATTVAGSGVTSVAGSGDATVGTSAPPTLDCTLAGNVRAVVHQAATINERSSSRPQRRRGMPARLGAGPQGAIAGPQEDGCPGPE